jgi:nucleoid DNA-binding protein
MPEEPSGRIVVKKSEFVDRVAVEAHLERPQAAAAVAAALVVIERSLAEGEDITLTGFGRFHVGVRVSRNGVNPRTGKPMRIAATTVPRFTAGSSLKKAVRS